MKDLQDRSGPWRGRWAQRSLKMSGTMRLQLTFIGDDIRGGGTDSGGGFTIDGSYDAATDEVAITKSYPRLTVLYMGKWDGTMICGQSSIIGASFFDSGEFEMWPASEEDSLGLAELDEASALGVRALAGALPSHGADLEFDAENAKGTQAFALPKGRCPNS